MILSAAQISHWILLYDTKEVGDDEWDKSSWWKDKEWLKEEFPLINLPFLVDCADNTVISQTNAIATYLGRELRLLGKSEEELTKCEELLCEITDLRNLMLDFAYKPDQTSIEPEAEEVLDAAKAHFEKLDTVLAREYPGANYRKIETKELDTINFSMNSVCHLVGNKFSVPDFFLWEILDQFEGLCKRFHFPACLGNATTYSQQVDKLRNWESVTLRKSVFPYLKEFHENFLRLPANHAYGAQYGLSDVVDAYPIILPYNNPYARFGSCPDPTEVYVRGQDSPWRNAGIIDRRHTYVETGIEPLDEDGLRNAARKRKGLG